MASWEGDPSGWSVNLASAINFGHFLNTVCGTVLKQISRTRNRAARTWPLGISNTVLPGKQPKISHTNLFTHPKFAEHDGSLNGQRNNSGAIGMRKWIAECFGMQFIP